MKFNTIFKTILLTVTLILFTSCGGGGGGSSNSSDTNTTKPDTNTTDSNTTNPDNNITTPDNNTTDNNTTDSNTTNPDNNTTDPIIPDDTTPKSFDFNNDSNVERETFIYSDTITVSSIDVAISISISNGEYKKNDNDWTSQNGTVVSGDTVQVRHESSNKYSTTTTTTLDLNGVTATFSSTTKVEPDFQPESFDFTDETDVELSTYISSDTITVSSINQAISISIQDGEYKKNNSSWTNQNGTVVNGDTIKVRHQSSNAYSTTKTTTLDLNGVTGTFNTTTKEEPADYTPDTFSFTFDTDYDEVNVTIDTLLEASHAVRITGLNREVNVSIDDGEFSIDEGSWITTGTLQNRDTIQVRHTSSNQFSTTKTSTITIGTKSASFSSTTEAKDTIPVAFDLYNGDYDPAPKKKLVESEPITISGINFPTNVTISTTSDIVEYSINGGEWVAGTSTTLNNDDNFTIRHATPNSDFKETNTTVTIGGVTDIFTTRTDDSDKIAFLTNGYPVSGNAVVINDEIQQRLVSSDGSFQYRSGTLTFELDGDINDSKSIILGSFESNDTNIDQNILLQEIVGNSRNIITSKTLSKIVLLLHSLDFNNDIEDGIEIVSNDVPDLNGSIENFSIDEIKNAIKSVGKTPLDKFEVMHEMLTKQKSDGQEFIDFVTYPENNESNIPPFTIVKIGFGQEMNSSIMEDNITLYNNLYLSHNSVGDINFSRCDYNNTQMLVVCTTPDTGLLEENNYTINLLSGIKTSDEDNITSQSYDFITGQKNILPFLRTGVLSTSYDEFGSSVSNGEIQDDSHYTRLNYGIERSFTRDNANNYVTDNNTTLIWQDDSNVSSLLLDWNSSQDYCANLDINGLSNWRVPTVKELTLTANKNEYNASIFATFTQVALEEDKQYWTADTTPGDSSTSYVFSYIDGLDIGISDHELASTHYLRCVHNQYSNNTLFIRDEVNDMVIDGSSGLMWQDDSDATQSLPWFNSNSNTSAIHYCEDLELAGYSDWRLPNYNELSSLIENKLYSQNSLFVFKNMSSNKYWTSTTYSNDTADAWVIDFSDNSETSSLQNKETSNGVRCVRGTY